jgi:gluconate kinase
VKALHPDFLPFAVRGAQRPFSVEFCHLGRERLTRSFFEDHLQPRMRLPFNQLLRPRCTLDALVDLAKERPGLPPTGFIFHMSRCGSTLLAQLLAALPENVVLSEAAPIDSVLQLGTRDASVTDEDRVRWLQAMVSALGQPRAGGETRLFVKLDSWHTHFLPLIRRAFPSVPWIFLYREPLEVLVSQARQRGSQMIPGVLPPALVGIPAEERAGLTLDAYAARVLAGICRAALAHRDTLGRFVSYRELPDALEGSIAAHFGLGFTPEERALLATAARRDAKSPTQPFQPDTSAKQREATASLRALADEWLGGLHAQLEAARGSPPGV